MNFFYNAHLRFKSSYVLMALSLAVSAILLAMVLWLHFWKNVSIELLTTDPVTIGKLPVYAGFLSQLGIFIWAASAAICFFCYMFLVRFAHSVTYRYFFLASGLLTTLLGLDDAFLLHELLFPLMGIPQKVVLAAYVVLMAGYLLTFYRFILETEYIFLGVALSCFGMSVLLDVFHPAGVSLTFYEEGSKLVGLIFWLVYYFQVGQCALEAVAGINK